MFVGMFMIQIVTLISALVSVFIRSRLLPIIPAILCPIVTVLMVYTYSQVSQSNWYIHLYLPGYWLTYPSTFAFIANSAWKLTRGF